MSTAGLPVRAALRPDGLYLELRTIAAADLQDAFMAETVARVASSSTLLHISSAELGRAAPGEAPAGIIFHVARCGSTLVSQLLKACDDLVVYSEPQPINELLVPPQSHPRETLVAALRSLGAALGRHAGRPYVLKLSSWNVLFCETVLRAFPSTPWAICVRDPVEVCVSLMQQKPGWMRAAGTQAFPFSSLIPAGERPELFSAHVFAQFCHAAARLDPARGKLISYENLPDVVWTTLAPHFGISLSADVIRHMAGRAQRNAKAAVGQLSTFEPDGAAKRAAASPALIEAIATHARPALAKLRARFGA